MKRNKILEFSEFAPDISWQKKAEEDIKIAASDIISEYYFSTNFTWGTAFIENNKITSFDVRPLNKLKTSSGKYCVKIEFINFSSGNLKGNSKFMYLFEESKLHIMDELNNYINTVHSFEYISSWNGSAVLYVPYKLK